MSDIQDTLVPQPQTLRLATPLHISLIGIGLIIFLALLLYVFVNLWPSGLTPESKGDQLIPLKLFGYPTSLYADSAILLLVMLSGGIGAFVHSATSFGDFVGNQKLTTNWIWWYLLRPFIGMALATVMYLAFRGGFLSVGNEVGKINIYATVALAAMVGMFSKQATDKLSETFTTLFKTSEKNGDNTRSGSLEVPHPVAGDSPDEFDGCALDVINATPDEALPPARGGIAS